MKSIRKDFIRKNKHEMHANLEKKIMQYHDHPFIVKLWYAFQNEYKLYMVMDYCSGGELFFHIKSNKRLDENRAKFYTAQIVLVLE